VISLTLKYLFNFLFLDYQLVRRHFGIKNVLLAISTFLNIDSLGARLNWKYGKVVITRKIHLLFL